MKYLAHGLHDSFSSSKLISIDITLRLECSLELNKLHRLLYHRDRNWKIDYCKSEPEYFGSGEGFVSDPEESDVIEN